VEKKIELLVNQILIIFYIKEPLKKVESYWNQNLKIEKLQLLI